MIVGLTGGIGSGKTTVAALLGQKGAFVIDTDAIAREVVCPPSPLLEALQREFGAAIIDAEGKLDRTVLARIIFSDEGKRAKLNELMHPEILKRVLSLIGAQPAGRVIVVVVPLLFESKFESNCDVVVAVVAPPDVRRQRIAERDGLTTGEIEARMRAQLPDAQYERRANIVVRNDGNLTALGREVDRAWEQIIGRTNRPGRPAAGKP
jgi:dephospho-CoA kinase